jgi:hypothetical protein
MKMAVLAASLESIEAIGSFLDEDPITISPNGLLLALKLSVLTVFATSKPTPGPPPPPPLGVNNSLLSLANLAYRKLK